MSTIYKSINVFLSLCMCLLFSACSGNAASANAHYVKASGVAEKAVEAFDSGNYSEALELAKESKKIIDEILGKYADSDIALKIVSDNSLRLGYMPYTAFRDKFMPTLQSVADEDMQPFDFVWAMAYASPKDARDANILEFAKLLVHYTKQTDTLKAAKMPLAQELDFDSLRAMVNKCFSEISLPSNKATLSKLIDIAVKEHEKKKSVLLEDFASPQQEAEVLNLSQKFWEDTEKNVGYLVYKMDAADALLKVSETVSKDAQASERLKPILKAAMENAQKITTLKQKNKAISTLIFAMANIKMSGEAFVAVTSIENDEALRISCLEKVAYSYAKNNDFDTAVDIVTSFVTGEERAGMLLKFSNDLTDGGLFERAKQVALAIKDPQKSSAALTHCAANAWKSDKKISMETLKLVKVWSVSELIDFCKDAGFEVFNVAELDAYSCVTALAMAENIAKFDKEVSQRFLNMALDNFGKISDKKTAASVSYALASFMLHEKQTEKISEFISSAVYVSDAVTMSKTLANLGLEAYLRGMNNLALDFFTRSFNTCKASESDKDKLAIYLAWQMQMSGLKKTDAAKILSEALPKFSKL